MLEDSERSTADAGGERPAAAPAAVKEPEPSAELAAETDAPKAKKSRGRRVLAIIGLAALLGLGWYAYSWWTDGRFLLDTDDAYVGADFVIVAPKTTGYVVDVPVRENSRVAAGDVLAVIDARDYEAALAAAEARVAAQRAALTRIDRQIDAARAAAAQADAQVAAAEAERTQAEEDYERYARLSQSNYASGQQLEAARAAKTTAEAAVVAQQAAVVSAQSQIAVVEAQRAEAEAALAELQALRDSAALDLENATIRAPFDGVVGNLSVAVGDYVAPGRRLMAVVPLAEVYIDANFKETQIADLAPGMRASVAIDAYPERGFEGAVQSFAPASGAVFSLLPAENATGNFTKVVQRVPVRISVPPEVAAEGWLRPGLSVVVTVDRRTGAAD